MVKLDFFRKQTKASGRAGTSNKVAAKPAFSIEKIQSKSSHLLGTVICFCIDSQSIQMAAVRHWGKSRRLLDIKKEFFPQDAAGKAARNEIILREIAQFVDANWGYGTIVTLAASGPETTFRTFLMPKLKPGELRTAIGFEAKRQIPFPLEDCTYDYRPTYIIRREDSSHYKIALQAATTRFIREQLEPFEFQGLKVRHVYHTQDVIGDFLRHLSDYRDDKNYTLLNIGLKSTEISFYKGTTLEFSHATSHSSVMLGAYAEQTRYEYFAESIANEIQTSLDYYAGQYSGSHQDKIYVYGDLAYREELLDLVNAKSGIELVPLPVSELHNLSPRERRQEDIFRACLPVLAAAACQSSLANLLPCEYKATQVRAKSSLYGKVAVFLLTVALGLSWLMLNNRSETDAFRLAEVNRQVQEFRSSDAFHTYNLVKRQIALDQSYLEQTREAPSYLALNFKELSQLTPAPIKLIYLDYDPAQRERNIYLHGLVESSEIPPEVILAEYVEVLSQSPYYDNVSLVRHVKRTLKDKFQIDFQIHMRGVA